MINKELVQYLNRGFIWKFNYKDPEPYIDLDFEECKKQFYILLDNVIKNLIDSGKKILWTMSSGLDTSAILCHVWKYKVDPETICIDNGRTDVYFSKKLASDWGFNNHTIIRIDSDKIEQYLLEINSIFSSPIAHSYLFFSYYLFKHAEDNGYEVLVMGDGPDVSMLGTHDLHKEIIIPAIKLKQYDAKSADQIIKSSRFVENTVIPYSPFVYNSLKKYIDKTPEYNDEFFYPVWHYTELLKKYNVEKFQLRKNSLDHRIAAEWEQFITRTRKPTEELLRNFSFHQISPYLDLKLCNFILSLLPHYRYTLNSTKHLMRELYGDCFPSYIINKERTGFNPNDSWAEEYKSVIDYLLDNYVWNKNKKFHNYLDIEYLKSTGKFTFVKKWALINLSMWIEKWL